MNAATTSNDRQKKYRKDRKDEGLKEVRNLWCHPEDEETLRFIADALRQQRADKAKRAGYAVHHINGDPNDNRPENLQIVKVKANRKAKEQKK